MVYLPELVGKWMSDPDNPNDFILFESSQEPIIDDDEPVKEGDMISTSYTDSLSGNGWSMKTNDTISVTINGVRITDREAIIAHYDTLIGESRKQNEFEKVLGKKANQNSENQNSTLKGFAEGMKKLGEGLKKARSSFDGTVFVTTEKSYKMIVQDNGERYAYQAHIAKIGEDLFLDIYPLPEYTDKVFGNNLFPVHTFMKLKLENSKLELTQFDLEKLNNLFESNLVRLRHEMVDGTVLITAQPKEIQKFLDKYSNEESVFEGKDIYTKSEE